MKVGLREGEFLIVFELGENGHSGFINNTLDEVK